MRLSVTFIDTNKNRRWTYDNVKEIKCSEGNSVIVNTDEGIFANIITEFDKIECENEVD